MTDVTTSPIACERPDTRTTERVFGWAMVISGIRCSLTYVVFPFVAPLAGFAPGVGPTIGVTIGAIAIVSNVIGYRRFKSSNHRWRTPAMVTHVGMIGLLVALIAIDGYALIS